MPSSIGKSQKASVAPVIKSTPGTGPSKASPVLIQSKPAPASSKPATTPAKQPQSSKPNGKMPVPSLSNSTPCASSPAVPKVDLMSLSVTHFLDHRDAPEGVDAEHMRSLVSMLEEWKCNHIHSEVADCLCELNQPYTHALFVHDIVTQCCDRGPSFFLKCAELLETLSRKPNCLNEAKLEEALTLLGSTGFVEEMRLDFPGYLDFFALIVARGSLCSPALLPFFSSPQSRFASGFTNGWIKKSLALEVFVEGEKGKGVGMDKLRAALDAALDAAEEMCESAGSGDENVES
jgi:hypothetical protein